MVPVLRRVAMVIASLALVVMLADEYRAQWTWLVQQFGWRRSKPTLTTGIDAPPDAPLTIEWISYMWSPEVKGLHCHPSRRATFECGERDHVRHAYAILAHDGCRRTLYALCADGTAYMRHDAVTTQRKLARMIWLWNTRLHPQP